MFERFIVATDLSPASFAVVKCIGGLKTLGAKECLLLQCLSVMEASSLAWASKTDVLESRLVEQKQILEEQGFVTSARSLPGFAKTEINRIAEEQNYSLIVVGSRGHTLAGEAMLGGVAYAVIHHARKAVLLVRVETRIDGGEVCIQGGLCDFGGHVLFPTDFSENADFAFRSLEVIVAAGVKRVTLFHVQDQTRIYPHLKDRLEEFNEIDRGRLEKMKAILATKGTAQIETHLAFGSPVVEIRA